MTGSGLKFEIASVSNRAAIRNGFKQIKHRRFATGGETSFNAVSISWIFSGGVVYEFFF